MSDEELRALARDGTPAGRIKLARALERVGRRDEALAVLVPAREDAEVRRVLGDFPAWRHENGDGGNTRYVDVAPLRSKPVVRWTVEGKLDPERRTQLHLVFLANPFAVVATAAPGTASVFDAESGDLRWSFDIGEHLRDSRPVIVGDRIVIPYGEEVVARDLWTGAELGRAPVPGLWELHRGDILVSFEDPDLVARSWKDPRTEPVLLWRIEIGHSARQWGDHCLVTDKLAVLGRPDELLGVDIVTGQEVFREPNAVLLATDEAGVLAMRGGRGLLEWRPARGWGGLGVHGGIVHALAPEAMQLSEGLTGGAIVDRVTGVKLWERLPIGAWKATTMARDVLYESFPGGFHAAVSLSGEELWEVDTAMDHPRADDVFAVVPAHERLYTYSRDGTVTCYVEGPR